ncbi:uncharacterized protein UTRI_03628 [Ustilago trichophora]|uniref:Uncharacterized protein n=1 Tax=Ustilago trichophora TaxID=86804 RepID=A0A5C3E2Q0_9BASI|nr:uncharacterized protein UTRI_03628 [Ustilago trichophora]
MKIFYIVFFVASVALQFGVANRIDDDWDILSGRFEEGRGVTLAKNAFKVLINKERRDLAQEFWDEVAIPKYSEFLCSRLWKGEDFLTVGADSCFGLQQEKAETYSDRTGIATTVKG